jgi:hypothetical protein
MVFEFNHHYLKRVAKVSLGCRSEKMLAYQVSGTKCSCKVQRTIKISASPINPRRVDYTFLRCCDVSPALRTIEKLGTYFKVDVFFLHGQGFSARTQHHIHHPAIRHGLYNLHGGKKYPLLHRVKTYDTTIVDP